MDSRHAVRNSNPVMGLSMEGHLGRVRYTLLPELDVPPSGDEGFRVSNEEGEPQVSDGDR